MHDLSKRLETLRRPRLLIRAARIGAAEYRAEAHLRSVLREEPVTGGPGALRRLIDIEEGIDHARRAGDAAYSPMRHVAVLIAMMGEARALCTVRDEGPDRAELAPVR